MTVDWFNALSINPGPLDNWDIAIGIMDYYPKLFGFGNQNPLISF